MNEQIYNLKNNLEKIYTIHYACSGFYNGGTEVPTISAISITSLKTGECICFAISDYLKEGLCFIDAEKKLLNNFVEFCNSKENLIFVNWNMKGLMYGFSAIYSRCLNFGINNFDFTCYKNFDISEVSDSNLLDTLKENDALLPGFLYGKDEANCFRTGNFDLIKLSIISKAKGLAIVFEKILNGKFEIKIY